ncbi:MAG: hypothetical protein Q8Q31_04350 [Nanoarchaeota archaeon]|nr:hypothetical protein [Nanoarchaeota archaeon]
MEAKKIIYSIEAIIGIVFGILFITTALLLGAITGEWFGKWTAELMYPFIILGVIFIIFSITYFIDLRKDYRWTKIVRLTLGSIIALVLLAFIIISLYWTIIGY